MNLPSGWYVVLASSDLRGSKPLGIRRMGLPLVAWRHAGKVVVQSDLCPHRGAKLSLGAIAGGTIACPFHGLKFGPEGQCTHVPEVQKEAPGICVKTYPTHEAHGWIWIHWRSEETPDARPPWFEEFPEKYREASFEEEWPVHFTRSVENQLDYAHLPFVHRTSIGRFFKFKKPEFETNDRKIAWYFGRPEAGRIEFLFPNIWQNMISSSYRVILAFVPIDESRTLLYLRSFRRYATWPPLAWLVDAADRALNRWILGQDRRVVMSQEPRDALQGQEILLGSDRFIRHFREWLSR